MELLCDLVEMFSVEKQREHLYFARANVKPICGAGERIGFLKPIDAHADERARRAGHRLRPDLITRDNVSVKVDAVLYFHVVDPEKSIIQVEQYIAATNMLAQTTLRSVLGQHELDELLAKRATLNSDVQEILDERTKEWGILVTRLVTASVLEIAAASP